MVTFVETVYNRLKKYIGCMVILLSHVADSGEIALTFDDAPSFDSAVMTGNERTSMLIKGLKESGIEKVLLFVSTKSIADQSSARLAKYVASGFELGNHSHSHLSANRIRSSS